MNGGHCLYGFRFFEYGPHFLSPLLLVAFDEAFEPPRHLVFPIYLQAMKARVGPQHRGILCHSNQGFVVPVDDELLLGADASDVHCALHHARTALLIQVLVEHVFEAALVAPALFLRLALLGVELAAVVGMLEIFHSPGAAADVVRCTLVWPEVL